MRRVHRGVAGDGCPREPRAGRSSWVWRMSGGDAQASEKECSGVRTHCGPRNGVLLSASGRWLRRRLRSARRRRAALARNCCGAGGNGELYGNAIGSAMHHAARWSRSSSCAARRFVLGGESERPLSAKSLLGLARSPQTGKCGTDIAACGNRGDHRQPPQANQGWLCRRGMDACKLPVSGVVVQVSAACEPGRSNAQLHWCYAVASGPPGNVIRNSIYD